MYRAIFFPAVVAVLVFWPVCGWALDVHVPVLNAETVHQRHGALLRTIASDEQALKAFSTMFPEMADALQAERPARARRSGSTPTFQPEMRTSVVQLMANLVVAEWARGLRNTIEHHDRTHDEKVFHEHTAQHSWLRASTSITELVHLLSFIRALNQFEAPAKRRSFIPPFYDLFVSEVDELHPELTGASEVWLAVLETQGVSDIHARLKEAWEKMKEELDSRVLSPDEAVSDAEPYRIAFMHTRLLPILTAQAVAHAILVRARAEHEARRIWAEMHAWSARQREARALARLCGTWRWIVHNHQNHRDHTMTISFLSPEQSQPGQPRPTTILIHGNTVYLRWEFPSGFQEDSLLLSNHDQRLEGTFINSRGPYGSISGKRLSRCSR